MRCHAQVTPSRIFFILCGSSFCCWLVILNSLVMSWLGKTTKSLFIFPFLFLSFLLSWTYYIEESAGKCHITSVTSYSHITRTHSVTSHDGSYDKCGKVVHRPYSSCISSVEKSNGNSIEFSLFITEQRVVGFILAWSLTTLQVICQVLVSSNHSFKSISCILGVIYLNITDLIPLMLICNQ